MGGNSFSSQTPLPYSVFLKLDDKTGDIIVYNEDKEIIIDPYLLRQIKRTEGYKIGVAQSLLQSLCIYDFPRDKRNHK